MSNTTEPAAPANKLQFPGSSNIQSAELLDDGVLVVTFKGGKEYRYGKFTPELMAQWGAVAAAGSSAGSWFDANVKKKPDAHPVVARPPRPGADAESQQASAAPPSSAPAPESEPPLAVTWRDSHDSVRALAREMYEAYTANSGGKAWNGAPCPAWDDVGDAVRSHWCAAALKGLAATAPHAAPLLTEIAETKRSAAATVQSIQTAVDAQVLERTKMIDAECGKLRQRIAELEAQQRERSQFAPWRDR